MSMCCTLCLIGTDSCVCISAVKILFFGKKNVFPIKSGKIQKSKHFFWGNKVWEKKWYRGILLRPSKVAYGPIMLGYKPVTKFLSTHENCVLYYYNKKHTNNKEMRE